MIPYTLKKSRRRSMAIVLRPDGTIEVRGPLWITKSQADALVTGRADWIEARLSARRAALLFPEPTDALLPLWGEDLPAMDGPAHFDGAAFHIPAGGLIERQRAATRLYRTLAQERLPPMLQALSQEYGLPYGGVRISTARSRWGSCSPKDVIALSWQLLALPEASIRHVMIHELCHTRHRDHGQGFRAMLRALCPDTREREEELRRWSVRLRACYTLLQKREGQA